MIPLCVPNIGEEEIQAVTEALKSGWLTHGPKNTEFEEAFARYINVKKAISLNSCTSALQLAIQALDIRGEVILPGFTFVASANAVVTAGARPVFADICYNTCNINPDDIEDKITQNTEAIMPVHYGGQSCEMERIYEIADKYHLAVIEDSAETIGGEYKGKKTGSFGIGCFSFFPTKNITTGEGGMLTTNDEAFADKVRTLVEHGISKSAFARVKSEKPWYRFAILAGYNFRMSNILAALGVEQLKKLDEMNEKRRMHAHYLNENLKDIEEIDLPVEEPYCKHVYQMYTIKLKNHDRNSILHCLRQKGIEASVHFDPPVHKQVYYQENGYENVLLPVTEYVANNIITLPLYPQLIQEELDTIIFAIKDIVYSA